MKFKGAKILYIFVRYKKLAIKLNYGSIYKINGLHVPITISLLSTNFSFKKTTINLSVF